MLTRRRRAKRADFGYRFAGRGTSESRIDASRAHPGRAAAPEPRRRKPVLPESISATPVSPLRACAAASRSAAASTFPMPSTSAPAARASHGRLRAASGTRAGGRGVNLGYRHLSYEQGSDKLLQDLSFSGPFIALRTSPSKTRDRRHERRTFAHRSDHRRRPSPGAQGRGQDGECSIAGHQPDAAVTRRTTVRLAGHPEGASP
jgi:hypothetical protein